MDAACYKLNLIKGQITEYFTGNPYGLLLGNHDTNYQGKRDSESEILTGILPQDTINNILYRNSDTGKSYFTIQTLKTKYFCFDTGVDQDNTMNAYRIEQCEWFANSLDNETASNMILMMHIVSNAGSSSSFAQGIMAFPNELIQIAEAYNERRTITVNGAEHNYSNATGKIWFVQCGHSHYDYVYTGYSIPVIVTTNATEYGVGDIKFDMVFVDYINRLVHLIRVNGTNRQVSI